MAETTQSFLSIAMERPVRARAVRISLIVGSILVLINHWERLLGLDFDGTMLIKIVLTFLVPYCVSTYSAVQAVREKE